MEPSPVPRRVLLFGKTGDGKSTVANMLMSGNVDGEIAAGNSLAAVTKQTKEFGPTDSNWTIIDTVGLFATDNPEKDHKRIHELRDYLAENHRTIDIFCYIKKASKFTRADEQCWLAFHSLFAHNGDHSNNYDKNVLLVFTSCRKGWMEENQGLIDDMMSVNSSPDQESGKVTFTSVGVDFPPRDEEQVIETKLEARRVENLATLKSAMEEQAMKSEPLPLSKLPEHYGPRRGPMKEVWASGKAIVDTGKAMIATKFQNFGGPGPAGSSLLKYQ